MRGFVIVRPACAFARLWRHQAYRSRRNSTSSFAQLVDEQERARQRIHRLPQSLDEALDAFAADRATQTWFPPALHAAYLAHKRCELSLMADVERDERCRRYREAY